MQAYNKKIVSSLITTILIVSILALPTPLTEAQVEYVTIDSITKTSGKVGDKVTISGKVPTAGGPVGIYWDTWENKLTEKYSTATGYAYEAYGVYEIKFKVPETPAGTHTIIVKDEATGKTATQTFTVEPEIKLSPTIGLPGDTITVTGTGFLAETKVTIKYKKTDGWGLLTTSPSSPETDDLGSFTCTFEIPGDAESVDNNIEATTVSETDSATDYATLTIGPYIKLTPDKGLRGSTVTVEGRGFTPGEKVDIRWYMTEDKYSTIVDDYTIGSDGTFSTTFTVPQVPDPSAPGDEYKVEAYQSDGKIISTATFTVVESAKISLSPESGKVGVTVTVEGEWFTEKGKKVTITFDTTEVATATTNDVGSFSASFKVPDVDAGTYTVTATDEKGVSASATFKVMVPVIEIRTSATSYLQGDTISIYAKCTEPQTGVILEITDPSGKVFYSIPEVYINEKVDDWYTISSEQARMISFYFTLPSDAPIGTWNFTAYDSAGKILDTNLFTVSKAALPGVEDLTNRVSALEESMATLTQKLEALSDKVDTLSTAVAGINLQALSTAIESVKSDVESLKTDISDISTTVSGVQSAVQNAVDAASEAKSAAESASSAVSNISMAVYGAIILSLIAALASIIAVVTLQRKIAG